MMIFLAALSALSSSPGEVLRRVEGDRPPVRLWMNNDRRYREGDRVRLQVDADVDGFLLVLNFDPSGRLRVLFPLDPRDDTWVQAGRRYEVRGQSNDAAFRAGGDGTGLIYSAVSEEPWRFDEIVLADRWDYTRLELDSRSADPEPEITELVQRLAGPRGFDYDVMGYRVYEEATTTSYNTYVYPGSPVYLHDDYLYCNNWNWRYDGCRRWPFDGGWSFGLGFYNPYYYGYYPYRYRYGYGYPNYPTWPSYPSGRAPVLAGRPRSYTVVPRGTLGNTSRPGSAISGPARGPSGGVNLPPIDWGNRARPVRGGTGREGAGREGVGRDASGRNGSGVSIPEANPPARRARGGEYSRPPEASGRGNTGYARPSRGEDYSRAPEATGRGNARPSRSEDYSRAPDASGRGAARPSRGEPSGREAPRARSEPQRREPGRATAPPRAEPRSSPPPRQSAPPAASSPSRGGGDGGGHSRPRKP